MSEPNVFITEIQVHETTDAFLVEQALAQAGVGSLEGVDDGANGCPLGGDRLFALGQAAEGRWDSNGNGHDVSPYFTVRPGALHAAHVPTR